MKKILTFIFLNVVVLQAEIGKIQAYQAVKTHVLKSTLEARTNLPLGGWAISREIFDWICQNFAPGSVIVECGSGVGSLALAQAGFVVYSIEHDAYWLNKYKHENIHYIYAPIRRRRRGTWYPIDPIKNGLPESYDLILVDGPTGRIGRYGFLRNIELFNTDLTMIFDDINRPAEKKLFNDMQELVQRKGFVLETDHTAGIIPAK